MSVMLQVTSDCQQLAGFLHRKWMFKLVIEKIQDSYVPRNLELDIS